MTTGSAGNKTFYAKWDREPYQVIVTAAEGAPVYLGADSQESAGEPLPKGATVTVVSNQGTRLQLEDGSWIESDAVTEVASSASAA